MTRGQTCKKRGGNEGGASTKACGCRIGDSLRSGEDMDAQTHMTQPSDLVPRGNFSEKDA